MFTIDLSLATSTDSSQLTCLHSHVKDFVTAFCLKKCYINKFYLLTYLQTQKVYTLKVWAMKEGVITKLNHNKELETKSDTGCQFNVLPRVGSKCCGHVVHARLLQNKVFGNQCFTFVISLFVVCHISSVFVHMLVMIA